jgi:hypothetical protein
MQRGHEAAGQPCGDGKRGRKREHASIDPYILRARQSERPDCCQHVHDEHSDDRAEHRTAHRDEHALGE